jgi:NAD+ diphosphatase
VGTHQVTLIPASRANVYSSSNLDRIATRREDPVWIAQKLKDRDTLFVPVWRTKNLVCRLADGNPEAVYLSGELASALPLKDDGAWAFLGILDDRAVFAIDISSAEDPVVLVPETHGAFIDLRAVGWGVPRPEASVLAHARGLMSWRQRTKFCSVCGNPCQVKSSGHMMQCTVCSMQHFPRTDPAVIMLVHREDRALLGHSARFPQATMYSTLAGFVEPGETLEEAVRREVLEESGISVGEVHYHSSQPWPFPGNIMLGFYAEGLSEKITIDPEELTDAKWFTREEMQHHKQHGFDLPRVDSIARRLIEDWLAHS